jgi:cell division protein FtsX
MTRRERREMEMREAHEFEKRTGWMTIASIGMFTLSWFIAALVFVAYGMR